MEDQQQQTQEEQLAELASALADDATVEEEGGILLSAVLTIQCAGCGNVLMANLVNEAPEKLDVITNDEVICPTCTKERQAPVVIPIAALAGAQVGLVPVEEDAGGAPALVVPVEAAPGGESEGGGPAS